MDNIISLFLYIFFIILSPIVYRIINEDKISENWMSKLPDDRNILLINIPGAHDAAANEVPELIDKFTKTQYVTIPELLKFGVRKFDIRVGLRKLTKDEKDPDLNLGTFHGLFECYYIDEFNVKRSLTFKHILLDIKDFLEKHPTETVIIWTQSENGDKYTNIKRAVELFEKNVGNIFIKYDKNLLLGDVRGKIISTVFKTDSFDSKGNPIYHIGYDGGTNLEETHLKFINKYYESFKVDGELKIKEIKYFLNKYNLTIEEAEEDFENNIRKYPINYSVACTGQIQNIIPLQKKQADKVNPFLLNFDFIRGNYYGWIDMDFITKSLVKKIFETNFIE